MVMVDPIKALEAWLSGSHEDRVMTIVEDGSFPEYLRPVLTELRTLRAAAE